MSSTVLNIPNWEPFPNSNLNKLSTLEAVILLLRENNSGDVKGKKDSTEIKFQSFSLIIFSGLVNL